MSGDRTEPSEGLDRRAVRTALGAETAGLEVVIGSLEKVSAEVGRLEGLLSRSAPDEEQRRLALTAIAEGLADLRSRVRESRDRLDSWADRLRDAGDPLAADLAQVRGILECIVRDQLEPARVALRNLLDELLPGEPA